MSGKGKTYELDKVKECHEATSQEVWATRPDFSGNSKYAFADVALVYPRDGAIAGDFFELKKRSVDTGKRTNVMSGSSKGQSGMQELAELVNMTPAWGTPKVGVKFPNRQLMVFNAADLLERLQERGTLTEEVGAPKKTRGDNISMYKPTLDEWESATAGSPDVELLTADVPTTHLRKRS